MTHLDELHKRYCEAAALAETHDTAHFWACADAAWDVYQQAKTDAEMAEREAQLDGWAWSGKEVA